MSKNKTALLTNDENLRGALNVRINSIINFNDYLSAITSTMIKKYPILIIDSMELPIFNEQKIVNSINQISPQTMIIFLSRLNDIEYQKLIRNNNKVAYYITFPIDMFLLEKVVENFLNSVNNLEFQYE